MESEALNSGIDGLTLQQQLRGEGARSRVGSSFAGEDQYHEMSNTAEGAGGGGQGSTWPTDQNEYPTSADGREDPDEHNKLPSRRQIDEFQRNAQQMNADLKDALSWIYKYIARDSGHSTIKIKSSELRNIYVKLESCCSVSSEMEKNFEEQFGSLVPPEPVVSFERSMFTDDTSVLLHDGVSIEEIGPTGETIISKLDAHAQTQGAANTGAAANLLQIPAARSKYQGKSKSAGAIRQQPSSASSRLQLSGSLTGSEPKDALKKTAVIPPMMRIFTSMCVDKGTMTDLPPEVDDDRSIGEETSISLALSTGSGLADRGKFVHSKRKQIISATKSMKQNSITAENSVSSAGPSADAVILSLQNSPNPLATLHEHYWKYIPSVFRARLLSTSVISAKSVSDQSALDMLFHSVRMELEKIEFCLKVGLRGVDKCTELTINLIAVGDVDRLDERFRDLMSKVLINLAELEVSALWCDIQLNEFRFLFEKLRTMGITNLAQMIRDCEPYSISQVKFVQSEKSLAILYERINLLKHRWATTLRTAPKALFVSEAEVQLRMQEQNKELDKLKEDNKKMKHDILNLKDSMRNLAERLMHNEMETDRTPQALLFYCTLLDPVIIPALTTVILELKEFKPFAAGQEHFEYTKILRGLQDCIAVIPTIERYLFRYEDLQRRWMTERVGKFTELALNGGDADAAAVCPLCSSDTRLLTKASKPGPMQQTRSSPEKTTSPTKSKRT